MLVYRNHKLAVVEAKAWDEALTAGVAQAKNYAGKLGVRYAYSTNGQAIYGIDMIAGAEGDISRFPTPPELWILTFREQDAWRDRFAAVPFEDKGGYGSRAGTRAGSPAANQSETGGRQSAHYPTHDGDQFLAPGRHTNVRASIPGDAVR